MAKAREVRRYGSSRRMSRAGRGRPAILIMAGFRLNLYPAVQLLRIRVYETHILNIEY